MARKITEVHVLPYDDGTKYKNGKPRIKWVVRTNLDLERERRKITREYEKFMAS